MLSRLSSLKTMSFLGVFLASFRLAAARRRATLKETNYDEAASAGAPGHPAQRATHRRRGWRTILLSFFDGV